MAEKLCELKKKGGGGGSATWVETILWANPSPSSDFAAQTVTLSDDINNYDYLKVSYVNYNGSTGTNDPFSVLISVSDFKTSLSGNSTRHNAFTYGGLYAPSNTTWTRFMFYNTDTTARFGDCTQVGGSKSANSNSVPLQILGISKGRVPSYKTIKDFIYDKVFNSGLPEIATLTSYNNRGSLVEGKIVADAVSHKVYAYVDFNVTTSTATSSWYTIFSVSSGLNNYRPMYGASSRQNGVPFITDDNSTVPTAQFWLGGNTGSSSTDNYLATCYGEGVTQGEHYILYMAYTYK